MIKILFQKILNRKEKITLLKIYFFSLIENLTELILIVSIPILFLLLQGHDVFINFLDKKNFIWIDIIKEYDYKLIINYFSIIFLFLIFLRLLFNFIFKATLSNFVSTSTANKIVSITKNFFLIPFENSNNYKLSDLQITLENSEMFYRVAINFIIFLKEITLLFLIIITIATQSFLTIIILAILGLIIFFYIKYFQITKLNLLNQKSRQARLLFYDNIKEIIFGLKEIKLFNKSKVIIDTLYNNVFLLFNSKLKVELVSQMLRPFFEFLTFILIITSLIIANIYSKDNLSDFLTFLTFLSVCLIRVLPSISTITNCTIQFKNTKTLNNKVLENIEIFKTLAKSRKINETEIIQIKEKIVVNNCSYVQSNKFETLKNINLDIKKGEKIGIFGKTGSGKSTLINLITGLINPTSRDVYYDNKKRVNETIYAGYVPQVIHLFNYSIKKNITFDFEDNFDEDKFYKIIKVCELEDFIFSKKDNINYLISDHGRNLSGGEKQRIGLARALYHNFDFLIMDEATSALDKETEAKILKNLYQFNNCVTLIIISHDPKNLYLCDRIFLVDKGEITNISNFNEFKNLKKIK